MDAIYRHQRFIYDLTRRNYLIGRDALISELDPPVGGSVLEVGCGTARNLICAARMYPSARFYGIDVSHEMLKTAQASIARTSKPSAIRVAHADATSFCARDLFGLDGHLRVSFGLPDDYVNEGLRRIGELLDEVE